MLRYAYIYVAESRPAIVAAMHHNAASIYYEQDAPIIVADWRDLIPLATAVRSSLERFSFRDCNLRAHKKTDCPSYIASRSRSVREFENAYLCIAVRALNEAELFYDASAQPRGEDDIVLHVTINRHEPDDEMGRKLLKLVDGCSTWAPKNP
jgi:hypothetical protein